MTEWIELLLNGIHTLLIFLGAYNSYQGIKASRTKKYPRGTYHISLACLFFILALGAHLKKMSMCG